jgi:hypothetical protein
MKTIKTEKLKCKRDGSEQSSLTLHGKDGPSTANAGN